MRHLILWIGALTFMFSQSQALNASPSPVESPSGLRLRMESSEVLGLWQALVTLAERDRSYRVGQSGEPELFEALRAQVTQLDPHLITEAQRALTSLNRSFKPKEGLYPRASSVAPLNCRLLIENQATQARDLLDLEARTRLRSICYAPDHSALFTLLHKLSEPYHKVVWEPQRSALERYVREVGQYIRAHEIEINEHLSQIEHFYGVSISPRVTYIAKAYPTLFKGRSKAAAFGYYIPISVSPSSKDYARSISVITHEFSHELYGSQPATLMKELEGAFYKSPSRESVLAQALLNEGLATATNNGGILYARLTGAVKQSAWYNDPLIDRFARALHPMIKEYLKENRSIDSTLIQRSVELYKETFGGQPQPIRLMVSNAHVSAITREQASFIRQELKTFKPLVNRRGSSAPFTFSKIKELLNKTLAEQGTVVLGAHDRSQLKSLPREVDEVYKEALKTLSLEAKSFAVLSAREGKAPVIILIAPTNQALSALFKELRSLGTMKGSLKVIELP